MVYFSQPNRRQLQLPRTVLLDNLEHSAPRGGRRWNFSGRIASGAAGKNHAFCRR
jgi:hypothetical protein